MTRLASAAAALLLLACGAADEPPAAPEPGAACLGEQDCPGEAGPCRAWRCSTEAGECVEGPADEGAACDDGDQCTAGDQCQNGACQGAHVDCADDDLCTHEGCDPATGCYPTSVPTVYDFAGGPGEWAHAPLSEGQTDAWGWAADADPSAEAAGFVATSDAQGAWALTSPPQPELAKGGSITVRSLLQVDEPDAKVAVALEWGPNPWQTLAGPQSALWAPGEAQLLELLAPGPGRLRFTVQSAAGGGWRWAISEVSITPHTVTCAPGDGLCTATHCEPEVGCVEAPLLCDDGDPCTQDACDDLLGCVHAACEPPLVCHAALGCAAPAEPGAPCTAGPECESGLCQEGSCIECLGDVHCQPGEWCDGGGCALQGFGGDACAAPAACLSGVCDAASSVCRCGAHEHCSPAAWCHGGDCAPKLLLAEACESDAQCQSGVCDQNCVECTTDGHCPGEYCADYECVECSFVHPCEQGWWCKGDVCAEALPNGAQCFNDDQCQTGLCEDETCHGCSGLDCGPTLYCDVEADTCAPKLPQDAPCTKSVECLSELCEGGTCRCAVPSKGCPQGEWCQNQSCVPLTAEGQPCEVDYECEAGACAGSCPLSCASTADCSSMTYCHQGACLPKLFTEACELDEWCLSDTCDEGACLPCLSGVDSNKYGKAKYPCPDGFGCYQAACIPVTGSSPKGSPCVLHGECESAKCYAGKCSDCLHGSCGDQYCSALAGACKEYQGLGQPCGADMPCNPAKCHVCLQSPFGTVCMLGLCK